MSASANAAHERLDMRDWRIRGDAMSEVEDQRTIAQPGQDGVDAVLQGSAAGDQAQRVQICLLYTSPSPRD